MWGDEDPPSWGTAILALVGRTAELPVAHFPPSVERRDRHGYPHKYDSEVSGNGSCPATFAMYGGAPRESTASRARCSSPCRGNLSASVRNVGRSGRRPLEVARHLSLGEREWPSRFRSFVLASVGVRV